MGKKGNALTQPSQNVLKKMMETARVSRRTDDFSINEIVIDAVRNAARK